MTEEWRPVVGYEGIYEVSSRGSLRSLPRLVETSHGHRRSLPGRTVSGWLANNGYRQASLSKGGRKRKESVHVIVASAFLGTRPGPEYLVCHFDGTRTNNRVENLRWATQSDNLYDAVRHGTHHWAAATHCIRGHAFDAANTYIIPSSGSRSCRSCTTTHRRARRAAIKAGRVA